MFKFSLRYKLLIFSVTLAVIPLLFAGRTMIRITKDELKSSANDVISTTAAELAQKIDQLYMDTWLRPLLLVTSGIDNHQLGAEEKISLIQAGIQNISDVVACQISIKEMAEPILITKDSFTRRLAAVGLYSKAILQVDEDMLTSNFARGGKGADAGSLAYIKTSDDWLLTIVIPLRFPIAGREAVFSARISLERLRQMITTHPFNRNGIITVLEANGHKIFDPDRTDLSRIKIVQEAKALIESPSRAIAVRPSVGSAGEKVLAGYTFPKQINWIVTVERAEKDAYSAVKKMIDTLTILIVVGLSIAILGALFFAIRISRPVEEIARVAHTVGRGNLDVQVRELKSRDEIADLAIRINEMIAGLRDRDFIRNTFGRYLSDEVVDVILKSKDGLRLGGEKRRVTIMMTDLRGFTALGERLPPESVVGIINIYLEAMAEIIMRYQGTIDEFIGDAILAIFGAPIARDNDAHRAVACALEMQLAMETVNTRCREAGYPEVEMGIGLNTGELVIGNIGSYKRTKYGVVGGNVNLTAHIESFTVGGQTLISPSTLAECGDNLRIDDHMKVMPKGVKQPITIYEVGGIGGQFNIYLPEKEDFDWTVLEHPLKIKYTILAGKDTGEDLFSGQIVALAGRAIRIQGDHSAEKLSNLKIRLYNQTGDVITENLYGKVVSVGAASPFEAKVQFTSVPPSADGFLKSISGDS